MSKKNERIEQARKSGRYEEVHQKAEAEIILHQWENDPKKQYVRRHGWLDAINAYIQKQNENGYTEPLKYLTLPGPKALDIGYFLNNGVLTTNEEGKLNVAICDKGQATQIANNLLPFGGVLDFSDAYLHDELENGDKLKPLFPFDIINMDLCNTFLKSRQDNLTTLRLIFELQRGKGFLLFLTTRERDPIQLYQDIVQENLNESEIFQQAYLRRFNNLDIASCTQDNVIFSNILFPKVVARLAKKHGFHLIGHFTARYQRDTGYSMLSYTFELEPLGRKDKNKYLPRYNEDRISLNENDRILIENLSPRVTVQANQAYEKYIATLPEGLSDFIDEALEQSPELLSELSEESRQLNDWMD